MRRLLATLLLASALDAAAAAEAPPARLDFLASPAVVGLGRWQYDANLPAADVTTLSHRLALALTPADATPLQVRAAAASRAVEAPLETADDRMRRLHGFTDVSLGAQWRVRGGDAGWLPHVAWLADVESTTGSPAFRDRTVRPSLRATAQWDLPHALTLGVMPGVYRDRGDGGKHYAAGVLAVTMGKAWTPRLQSFVELAGQRLSRTQAASSLLDVDTGVAFAATRTLQVAFVASRSLAGGASRPARGGLSVSSRF